MMMIKPLAGYRSLSVKGCITAVQQQQAALQEKLVVLRKHRQRIKSEANWKLFYYQFNRDHSRPNLIWNFKVRLVF